MIGGSVVGMNSTVNGVNVGGSSPTNSSSLTSVCIPLGDSSATSKEKTPMCLINELARYNKIQHQYCLTDEKGPAHKKTFTVTLRLGESEEYTASGPSIKKAQHSAAAIALEKTQFKHPPPKTQRQNKQTKLTPTVELNALAMKRGEAAIYTFMETPRPPNPYFNMPPNIRAMYNQKYYGRPPLYPIFFVTLRVGTREFIGEGTTAQQAKHNAASKALKLMKTLPMPENATTCTQGDLSDLDPNADLKSPISLVHEIALKRNLTVTFEVIRESGPPHVRTFVTVCLVGEYRTEGEGTGKKVSKKRAAELMLEELRKLPALPPTTLVRIKRKPTTKKKSRNLIKEQKAAPEYGQGINPISRLIQIQQAKKEKEPVYTLLAERGVPRRREFIMQVTVGSQSAQGSGPNKKLAKRAAAENMLQLLGYSRPQPQPGKPAIKTDDGGDQRGSDAAVVGGVNNMGQMGGPVGGGRQLVPGLIMMPDGSALHGFQQVQPQGMGMGPPPPSQQAAMHSPQQQQSPMTGPPQQQQQQPPPQQQQQQQQPPPQPQVAQQQQVPVQQQSMINQSPNVSSTQAVRPKDQLMYLAQILGLQVQFTDFPKGNKIEYLSLVSLSTNPPHVSHGAGPTIDDSHDQACLTALRALAKMGLDTVTAAKQD
ncbi:Double-stranded RNA-binding protein Staufen-like 1 [Homarus americanus]|uniref:Double-stranded RNA-binding protein Staufen-like 1 n=1 Tax=Homarus americanus TaxID=6706 RepID=A0A8J5JPZ2_HOMAM|nr:Double-stranded RNA-binding protein Staufen-like 1 [Homarus americanus]